MSTRPDEERLKIFGSFLRAHQQVSEALNKNLQDERGISLSWYDVLLQLSSADDGRMRLQDLAERVLYSRSGLTRLIDRMEAAGLVKRQPCTADKRGMYAALTSEGKRALKRAAPTHLRGVQEFFFSQLSEEEIKALGKAMESVVEANCAATDRSDAVATQ